MSNLRVSDTPQGRLFQVQARMRSLVRQNPRLRTDLQRAFSDFVQLTIRHHDAVSELRQREKTLTREQLKQGFLIHPLARAGGDTIPVLFDGLCPSDLAARLKAVADQKWDPELERKGATAALKVLEDADMLDSLEWGSPERLAFEEELAREANRTHARSIYWTVWLHRPDDFIQPVNPASTEPEDLQRFDDDEYRTICLYRLGGLADANAIRHVVARPPKLPDPLDNMIEYMVWRSRFPIVGDTRGNGQGELEPRALPPEFALEMLEFVEDWLASGTAEESSDATSDTDRAKATEFAIEDPPAKRVITDINDLKITDLERAAWKLSIGFKTTQTSIAKVLAKQFRTEVSQAKVSRMLAKVRRLMQASGLPHDDHHPAKRANVVDPSRLNMGKRTDKRRPRPSDMNADDDSPD